MTIDTSDLESLLKTGKATITVSATTDIWRKPPNLNVFNAPSITTSLPISKFKNATVSATAPWKTLYDQGGLLIVLPPKRGSNQKRWIKTGIEFYNGRSLMSVVAADEWADWSLMPLSPNREKEGKMTVLAEREEEDGGWGSVLRISLVDEKGVKLPIREVTWAFHEVEEGEIEVGVFAAKPTEGGGELVVDFEGFEVEYRT